MAAAVAASTAAAAAQQQRRHGQLAAGWPDLTTLTWPDLTPRRTARQQQMQIRRANRRKCKSATAAGAVRWMTANGAAATMRAYGKCSSKYGAAAQRQMPGDAGLTAQPAQQRAGAATATATDGTTTMDRMTDR